MIKPLGLLVVGVGFALRVNPLSVVVASGFTTECVGTGYR